MTVAPRASDATPGVGPSRAGVVGPAGGSLAAASALPAEGVLEELDGTRILPAGHDALPALPWHVGVAAAGQLTAGRPGLWAYALLAFLARGGVALIAIPTLVLPTFIGISNFVGPASVSAAGPGPRLVALVVLGVVVAAAIVVSGTAIAAAAETAYLRALAEQRPDPGGALRRLGLGGAPGPASARAGVARVTAIRLALLVPVAAAIALAVPPWVAVAYRELSIPSDVTVPLLVRVISGAPAATGLVAVAWLVGEIVGGFASRRAVLFDARTPRALATGLGDPFRAPVATILGVLLGLVPSVAALAVGAWAVSAAWEAARLALLDHAGALAVTVLALLLAGAWLVALALAAVTSGWRAALATTELLRRHPPGGP